MEAKIIIETVQNNKFEFSGVIKTYFSESKRIKEKK
jgi:hypothetical protein